jgi:hypothetical protein
MIATVSSCPLALGPPLPPASFAAIRRQAVFACCKWDPQIEDVSVLAPFPLVLAADTWQELATAAEALAAEALAAEAEILLRPELHAPLGLPAAFGRVLRRAARHRATTAAGRVVRFDFHPTADGWRISEANADVPGGFNEASGFARLMAPHYAGCAPAGDPAARLADAAERAGGPGGLTALVHATAYADDRQVMEFLQRQ